MTFNEQIITIALLSLATVLTRFLPFIIFRENKKTPDYITYLGKVLPASVFGMLVIYCIKNINLLVGNHGLPELIAITATIITHLIKRNLFISIIVGTACYMILIRII